jgi:hypothetical protein
MTSLLAGDQPDPISAEDADAAFRSLQIPPGTVRSRTFTRCARCAALWRFTMRWPSPLRPRRRPGIAVPGTRRVPTIRPGPSASEKDGEYGC